MAQSKQKRALLSAECLILPLALVAVLMAPVAANAGGGKLVIFEMHVTPFDLSVIFTAFYLLGVTVFRVFFHGSWINWMPESGLVIFLGVVYAGVLKLLDPSGGNMPFFEFKEDLFFFVLIPPIIFEAGYSLHKGLFFSNFWTINLYAILGTLFNTIFIGGFLYLVATWGLLTIKADLIECFLFSSLISAVDPVAVIAIFEEVHVHETLHMLVFGESVLNDAVSIVLYKLFLSIFQSGGAVDGNTIFVAIVKFLVIIVGGIIIGTLMGLCSSYMTKYTASISVVEPVVMLLFGYLSFVVSEIFRVSGIVAIMFTGIVMSHYTERNISRNSSVTIKYALKMLASTTETIVFMYLGISMFSFSHGWDVGFIIFTLIFCAIFRALGTLILTGVANRRRVIPVPLIDQFILIYGGLRGAIAFALAYVIPEDVSGRPYMVTTTLMTVLWTVFIQGGTIKPLLNYLKIKRANEEHAPSVSKQVLSRVGSHLTKAMRLISGENDTVALNMWRSVERNFLRPLLLRDPGNPEQALVQVWKDFQTHKLAAEIDAKAPTKGSRVKIPSSKSKTAASVLNPDMSDTTSVSDPAEIASIEDFAGQNLDDVLGDAYDADYTYSKPMAQTKSKLEDDMEQSGSSGKDRDDRAGLEKRIKGLRFGKNRGNAAAKREVTNQPLFSNSPQTLRRIGDRSPGTQSWSNRNSQQVDAVEMVQIRAVDPLPDTAAPETVSSDPQPEQAPAFIDIE
eukprot:TRINITY_DN313_c0_g1_i1.p1 TRINITY_DN313_c0_g1~~TRINITY_DN313_c0_g1_i1.p1  ORF type:complete len:735 (-),score=160.42 TRINITY_DN313_c0_g1_i1:414-2618(-)